MLRQEQIEAVMEFLDGLNITNDMFKEHLPELLFSEKTQKLLSGLPTKIKTALTRVYNKTHQTSIKRGKKSKEANYEHDNYDPDRDENMGSVSDSESEYEDVVEAPKAKAGKGKGKGKSAGKGKKGKKRG